MPSHGLCLACLPSTNVEPCKRRCMGFAWRFHWSRIQPRPTRKARKHQTSPNRNEDPVLQACNNHQLEFFPIIPWSNAAWDSNDRRIFELTPLFPPDPSNLTCPEEQWRAKWSTWTARSWAKRDLRLPVRQKYLINGAINIHKSSFRKILRPTLLPT